MAPSKKNLARMNAERKMTKAKEYLAEQKVRRNSAYFFRCRFNYDIHFFFVQMIWGDEPKQRHVQMKTYIETQLFAPFQAAFAFNPLRSLVYLMFRETKRRRSTFTTEELDQAASTVQVCGRLMLLHVNHGRTGPMVYPKLEPMDINRFRVYLSTVVMVPPFTQTFEEFVDVFVRELTPSEPNATLVPLPYHQEKWLGFTPAMWDLLTPTEDWKGIHPPTPAMFAQTPFLKGMSV